MCAGSPESHLCPSLQQQQHGQQGEEGDCSPLFRSRETRPGALRSILGPQHQRDRDLLEQVPRRP